MYNSNDDEFLVNWVQPRGGFVPAGGNLYIAHPNRLVAQRLSADGTLRGSQVVLRNPVIDSYKIAYSPASNEYLTTWTLHPNYSVTFEVYFQRFADDTLATKGSAVNLSGLVTGGQHFAQASYDPNKDRYLVTWWDGRVAPYQAKGRLVQAGTGSLVGAVMQITDATDSALFIPYSTYSLEERRYLVVTGTTTSGLKGRYVSDEGVVLESSFTLASSGMAGEVAARVGGDASARRYVTVWERNGDIFSKSLPEVLPPITLSITDMLSNPIPDNVIALNNDGIPVPNPFLVSVDVNNTEPMPRNFSLSIGDQSSIARFRIEIDPGNACALASNQSTSVIRRSLLVNCIAQPGLSSFVWSVRFEPSETDAAFPIVAWMGANSASLNLSVPQFVSPFNLDVVATCEPTSKEGRLYKQMWQSWVSLPQESVRWETTPGSQWESIPALPLLGQWSAVPDQLNLAYETSGDIADAIVQSCFKLVAAPSDSDTPSGVVFRMRDPSNFYSFGFVNSDTLALGKTENGVSTLLASRTSSYSYGSTDMLAVRIVLTGQNVTIYVALEGETFRFWGGVSDSAFSQGYIGYSTVGVQGTFAPIWADFDCMGMEVDLSSIGRAVFEVVGPQTACQSQVEELISLPPGRDGFLKMADLIKTANYEVDITNMIWERAFKKNKDSGEFELNRNTSLYYVIAGDYQPDDQEEHPPSVGFAQPEPVSLNQILFCTAY